jgi:hypothetical protein
LNGARVLFTVISAALGTCFAILAGLSISVIVVPVRQFHVFSAVIAAVASCLAYLGFRAATAGDTDDEIMVTAVRRGIRGALVGLIVVSVFLLLFGTDTRSFLAHALGKPTYSFTNFRVLLASVLLGFGTGFVVHMPIPRNRQK